MPENKREIKAKMKGDLYDLPKSYDNTHEHKDGQFKDGKLNIWMWNINGVNS